MVLSVVMVQRIVMMVVMVIHISYGATRKYVAGDRPPVVVNGEQPASRVCPFASSLRRGDTA